MIRGGRPPSSGSSRQDNRPAAGADDQFQQSTQKLPSGRTFKENQKLHKITGWWLSYPQAAFPHEFGLSSDSSIPDFLMRIFTYDLQTFVLDDGRRQKVFHGLSELVSFVQQLLLQFPVLKSESHESAHA